MNNIARQFGVISVVLIHIFMVDAVSASTVDSVIKAGIDKTTRAQDSQQFIDKLANETSDILWKYRTVNKHIEGLRVYNTQLEKQIANQQIALNQITASIENAAITERLIVPLTIRMLGALEQFVNLDLPFNREVRLNSIAQVRTNLETPEFSIAEKFRQVLELYRIESEYGNTIDQYSGLLVLDGRERQVTFLRVGRIALIYQTTDQNQSGVWSSEDSKWRPLSSHTYRSAIAKGIRIAKKQAAIEMLMLPVSSPVTS
jgi:hypothetical protein